MRQIVLDTETTGLSPKEGHRIIEIGCLELVDRRLTGNQYHCYLNPQREVDTEAAKVHGMTQEFLADKPLFADIVQELLAFINSAELIIHNAPFDLGFLDHELKLAQQSITSIADCCAIVDTLVLARKKHPGQQVSLDALCRRYHVDNTNRDLHGALLDAQLLAHVYLQMTGGQTWFNFDDAEELANVASAIMQQQTAEKTPLAVILATADEQKAHRALLEKIKKDSGVCQWQDD